MATFGAFILAPTAHGVNLDLQPHGLNMTYQAFLATSASPRNHTTIIAFCLLHRAALIHPGCLTLTPTVAVAGRYPDRAVVDGPGIAINGAGVAGIAAALPGAFPHLDFTAADLGVMQHFWLVGNSARFIVDLCIAASHKQLTTRNVRSYFLQYNIITEEYQLLCDMINYIGRRGLADLNTPNARALITNTLWGQYRISATSIGSCFLKSVTAYTRNIMERVLGPASIAALDLVVADPWNKALAAAVPRDAIGIIACSLRAARDLNDTWRSGHACMEALGIAVASRYRTMFETILNLMENRTALQNLASVDDILLHFGIP